ncbi:MAG: hypothetical protein MUC49_16635 [Raineya sp.]|nr:hypothetical protein [Raineya sp.]
MNTTLKYYVVYHLTKNNIIQLAHHFQWAEWENHEFYNQICGREVDLEEEGYEIIPEVKNYFDSLELKDEDLAKLTDIYIMGGNFNMYEIAIHPRWQYGDDNATTVFSLEGIEKLINLQFLKLECIDESINLSPLKSLKKLKNLEIAIQNNTDLSPLAELTTIEKIKLVGGIHEAKSQKWLQTKQILDSLENRGVVLEKNFFFYPKRFI